MLATTMEPDESREWGLTARARAQLHSICVVITGAYCVGLK